MKILIVEDDKNKINQVKMFLKETIPTASITEKYSYQTGLKEILKTKYNLILLDMSMPNFDITIYDDGGRLKPFAGKELLRQMKRRRIVGNVVVITQFEKFGEISSRTSLNELQELLETNYSDNFKGIVYYNPAEKKWMDDLLVLIGMIGEDYGC